MESSEDAGAGVLALCWHMAQISWISKDNYSETSLGLKQATDPVH